MTAPKPITFVLACKGGHRVSVITPEMAKRLTGTACATCFRPLFVVSASS